MSADPVDFTNDAGEPGYSAKVNRLIRQDIRMGRPLGNQALWVSVPGDAQTRWIHICRFPFRPKRNPYNRLFVILEYDVDTGTGTGVPTFGALEYTLNDAATWTPATLNATFPPWSTGTVVNGSLEIDLSAISAATWIGVRQPYSNALAADPFDLILQTATAFLFRADYPPF
jgi:hypothetical protein